MVGLLPFCLAVRCCAAVACRCTGYRKVSPLRLCLSVVSVERCFDSVFGSFLVVVMVVCIGEIYLPSGK